MKTKTASNVRKAKEEKHLISAGSTYTTNMCLFLVMESVLDESVR